MSAVVEFRTREGRFAPGQSGNPAGRPKGSRNRTTLLAEALSEEKQEALVQKLVEDALAGDRVLLRFCVERILGKPAHRTIALDLASGKESDPEAILAAAMRALADGEISPDEAVRVARAASTTSRVRVDRVHEQYVAAGIRLRELQGESRVLAARAAASTRKTQRLGLPPGAGASPENGLLSRGDRKMRSADRPRAVRAAKPLFSRAPVFGLLSPPTRRAALLGSVSPLAFAEVPKPEIDLYPAMAPDPETLPLAA